LAYYNEVGKILYTIFSNRVPSQNIYTWPICFLILCCSIAGNYKIMYVAMTVLRTALAEICERKNVAESLTLTAVMTLVLPAKVQIMLHISWVISYETMV
jgi:hypothetical protein